MSWDLRAFSRTGPRIAMFITMAETVEPEKMVRRAPDRPETTGFSAARRQYL